MIANDFARVRLAIAPNDVNGLAALARVQKLQGELVEELQRVQGALYKAREEAAPRDRGVFAGDARSPEEMFE